MGYGRGDQRWREENATADDVRDDDGRGIERPQTSFERWRIGMRSAIRWSARHDDNGQEGV